MTFKFQKFCTISQFLLIHSLCWISATAQGADENSIVNSYRIQPGDVLLVSVWKEEDLIREVIVRPDGQITFPLVGEAAAAGNSIESLRLLISERLKKYIPDPGFKNKFFFHLTQSNIIAF